jgi:Uma2 family endonuclease
MAANPSDPPRHFYSLDEYFALEHAGDARYEYWDGDIFCMSGGSLAHGMIAANIIQCLGQKLAGTGCLAFTGDTAIKTPTLPPYRYPDASIVCGGPRVENVRGVDALLNPVLVVEVGSPSTEIRDRGDKFRAYQQIGTFREYLLVSQQTARVTHHLRGADGIWTFEESSGLEAGVRFMSVDCRVSLAEIYEGVTFTAG